MVFGLLVVHKPIGPTSHDIVAAVRRGTGERRVGHGGTLDPLAEGVLLLGLGQATRLLEYASNHDKAYRARVMLGVETDTYDAEGEVLAQSADPCGPPLSEVEEVLDQFRGEIRQTPPAYSALKIDGKAAYKRARAGEAVELAPRYVSIYELRLEAFEPPWVELYVHCSSGTYIRTLAHDIGQALECGAHLARLTRLASGHFTLEEAISWEVLTKAFKDGTWSECLISPDSLLAETPELHLDESCTKKIRSGQAIAISPVQPGLGRAYDPAGQFIAVVKGDAGAGVWRPHKVFAQPAS